MTLSEGQYVILHTFLLLYHGSISATHSNLFFPLFFSAFPLGKGLLRLFLLTLSPQNYGATQEWVAP